MKRDSVALLILTLAVTMVLIALRTGFVSFLQLMEERFVHQSGALTFDGVVVLCLSILFALYLMYSLFSRLRIKGA